MKIFIVFIAITLLFGTIFYFTSDMNRYIRAQLDLKNLAEDCAAAAALCLNEETLTIDLQEAENYVIRIIKSNKQFPENSVSVQRCELTKTGLGVRLELLYDCGELFRLPFLSVKKIVRISEYAWE